MFCWKTTFSLQSWNMIKIIWLRGRGWNILIAGERCEIWLSYQSLIDSDSNIFQFWYIMTVWWCNVTLIGNILWTILQNQVYKFWNIVCHNNSVFQQSVNDNISTSSSPSPVCPVMLRNSFGQETREENLIILSHSNLPHTIADTGYFAGNRPDFNIIYRHVHSNTLAFFTVNIYHLFLNTLTVL